MRSKITFIVYLLGISILISCKKDANKNNLIATIENQLAIPLQKSEKIIEIENVKSDTLNETKIASFIANYSFQKIRKIRNRLSILEKKSDTIKQINFKEKKSLYDSLNYYTKIVDKTMKTKKASTEEVIQNIYRLTTHNQQNNTTKTFVISLFEKEKKVMNSKAFFQSESEKILNKK